MHRLFVGLTLPAPIRAQLLSIMGGVSGARWQSEAQLHLTIRFIGPVDRPTAADIDAALSGLSARPVEIALAGLGLFDRRGFADSLWAGLRPHAPLQALHNKVDQTLRKAGIAPDTQSYLPHVTLARLNRNTGPLDAFMTAHNDLGSAPFRIDQLCLYESHLTQEGATYTVLAHYPLH